MPADRDPLHPYDPAATALPAPTPAEAVALARLYDLDLAQDPGDLDLYLALAGRTGGPLLELATGTGRLAVPLAEQGYLVTGVDIDPAMLARAQARADATRGDAVGGLRFVIGDARSVRLPDAGRYQLAFLALNSLFIMGSRADQQAVVTTLATHLAPGGLAVIDVWLPDADDLARYDGRLILEYERPDPASQNLVTKVAAAQHDAASGIVTLTSVFEEG
ncbi:MAG: class I SAM-dependent methyltransferase, partial [Chloroflexota bacterium]|nr:class I SAM-dependent methyltransferase [Chloroflexota bacterium]